MYQKNKILLLDHPSARTYDEMAWHVVRGKLDEPRAAAKNYILLHRIKVA